MDIKEQEFSRMVRENKSTIYTVCYMFSNDEDEVSDLFQETLINLWKGFESFRHESKLSTWIYRVAMNTCISADRKKRRQGSKVPLSMNINLYDDEGIRYVIYLSRSCTLLRIDSNCFRFSARHARRLRRLLSFL